MDIDKIVVFNASNVITPNDVDPSGSVQPSPIAALQSNETQNYLTWVSTLFCRSVQVVLTPE